MSLLVTTRTFHYHTCLCSRTQRRSRPCRRFETLRTRRECRRASPAYGPLDRDAAKWQIYELDERAETCAPSDCDDSGNIVTRLVRAIDVAAAHARFAASIARIKSLAYEWEVHVESPSEIVFRLHGLEFARARMAPVPGSFRNDEVITSGLWPAEHTFDETNETFFRELVNAPRRAPAGAWYSRRSHLSRLPRTLAGIRSQPQTPKTNSSRGLVVNNKVIVELKCARTMESAHEAQLLNYFKATGFEIDLLLNFGHKPQFKRMIFDVLKKNLCKSAADLRLYTAL